MDQRLTAPDFAPGSVWMVGAGPGDPGLLTLYALHALEQADVVFHDSLVDPAILDLAHPRAHRECVGKRAGRPSWNQLRINQRLIAAAEAGQRVLRLKGGDPFVFGRGGEEALALAAAEIPFRVVPAVTAGIGGAAYAGVPVTHRGSAQAVAFVTGHGAAGHPPRGVDWRALGHAAPVLVLYMALRRIDAIAGELIAAGRDPDEPVLFVSEATTLRQSATQATLATAASVAATLPTDLPTLIVVGETVAMRDALAPWQATAPFLPAAAAAGDASVIQAAGL